MNSSERWNAKKQKEIVMPRKQFLAEHKRLLKILDSAKAEAERQRKELAEMEGGVRTIPKSNIRSREDYKDWKEALDTRSVVKAGRDIKNRREFQSWLGTAIPNSGAIQEFRKKMAELENRSIRNFVHVTDNKGVRELERSKRIYTDVRPGEQMLFINYSRELPYTAFRPRFETVEQRLRGEAFMSGGALTQVSRRPDENESVSSKLQKMLSKQAEQIKEYRTREQQRSPPDVITAKEEGVIEISTALQVIGNAIQRQLFDRQLLTQIQKVSALIAKYAPLMEPSTLAEISRYVSDHANLMRMNSGNIRKETAYEALDELEGELEGQIYEEEGSDVATIQTNRFVEEDTDLLDSIFDAMESLNEFLKRQMGSSYEPVQSRINTAKASLKLVGIKMKPSDYTKQAQELLAQLRRDEQAEKDMQEAELAQPMDAEVADAMGLPPVDVDVVAGADNANVEAWRQYYKQQRDAQELRRALEDRTTAQSAFSNSGVLDQIKHRFVYGIGDTVDPVEALMERPINRRPRKPPTIDEEGMFEDDEEGGDELEAMEAVGAKPYFIEGMPPIPADYKPPEGKLLWTEAVEAGQYPLPDTIYESFLDMLKKEFGKEEIDFEALTNPQQKSLIIPKDDKNPVFQGLNRLYKVATGKVGRGTKAFNASKMGQTMTLETAISTLTKKGVRFLFSDEKPYTVTIEQALGWNKFD